MARRAAGRDLAGRGPEQRLAGGTGESWERGPYFLVGLLPLAWQLDDPVLKAKAQRFIEWTLDSAKPSGMFGPRSNDDWWPRMVMLKVLIQYHKLAGDPRVISLMTGYFAHQLDAMPARPLRDWGRFRWQDEVASVIWLYSRTGDARLLELAALLRQQGFTGRPCSPTTLIAGMSPRHRSASTSLTCPDMSPRD